MPLTRLWIRGLPLSIRAGIGRMFPAVKNYIVKSRSLNFNFLFNFLVLFAELRVLRAAEIAYACGTSTAMARVCVAMPTSVAPRPHSACGMYCGVNDPRCAQCDSYHSSSSVDRVPLLFAALVRL